MNIRENFQSKLQQLREGTEQLDELSKGKLGDYVKKASHDVATKSAAVGRYADRANKARDKMKKGDYSDWQQGKKDDEFADKMFKKSWKRREGIAKATDKLTKEDYDPVAKKGAERADIMHHYQSKFSKTPAASKYPWIKKNLKYWKKESEIRHKKAVTGMDEAKSAPDRVVTASKKAEKGTKWKLQARNMDSDGSEMELRQGKRVKATGVFDRHAQDFQMTPAKKNKTDWKAKSKTYDDPKDIMKTVKE